MQLNYNEVLDRVKEIHGQEIHDYFESSMYNIVKSDESRNIHNEMDNSFISIVTTLLDLEIPLKTLYSYVDMSKQLGAYADSISLLRCVGVYSLSHERLEFEIKSRDEECLVSRISGAMLDIDSASKLYE